MAALPSLLEMLIGTDHCFNTSSEGDYFIFHCISTFSYSFAAKKKFPDLK